MKPNIIVLTSDTFRPDYIGGDRTPHRNVQADTPELDAFLAESVTFDQARIASFPTIPMREDCFTGRFSHIETCWRNMPREQTTLPDVLGAAGYTSQLIADTTHMLRAHYWEHFDHFHFLRGHESDAPLSRMNDPLPEVVKDLDKTRVDESLDGSRMVSAHMHAHTNFRRRYDDESQCAEVSNVVCRWVEDNYRGNPFFLWVDYFDVHEPWYPPEYLLDKYHPGYAGDPMPHCNYRSVEFYEPEELRNMQARYAAMCTLLSKHAGRVLRLVKDTGLAENTIVVFLSDHGTLLGEHGHTGKTIIEGKNRDCFPFHPEIARECWTMWVPEALGNTLKPGTRLPHLAQPADLLPTLLDFAGIPVPSELEVQGESLAPLFRGKTDAQPRPVSITASTTAVGVGEPLTYSRRPGVTDGEWTLFLAGPPKPSPPELYHTLDDPYHERECLAEDREHAQRLHRAMLDELARLGASREEVLERLSAENVGLA